jgi:phosphopantothenate--cysteine ligase
MNIIITAGGTTERIDAVRKITNTATGRLGSLTAAEFVKQGGSNIKKIFYICEKGTITPQLDCVEVINAEGVCNVKNVLSDLLTSNRIDAVVHSMAVSDYTVDSLTTVENLAQFLSQKLFSVMKNEFQTEKSLAEYIAACIKENDRLIDNNKKISSNVKNLMLFMSQTPKLISLIKELQPPTILVGFKLLNCVDKKDLLNVGYELLKNNACDLVLANDSNEIDANRHVGYLISPDMTYVQFQTKEEIAHGIVQKVLSIAGKEVSKS